MTFRWQIPAVLALASLSAPALAQSARTVNDGVYSEAQATRGKAIYAHACARCHGPDGTGGGGGPTLAGPFWSAWYGRTVGDLFELTRNSMPMDGPGSLTDHEYADVVAYMMSLNLAPAGAADLVADGDALKSIAIVRKR